MKSLIKRIKEVINLCDNGKIFTTKSIYKIKTYERGTRTRYYIVKRNIFRLFNIPLFRRDEIVANGENVYFGYTTLEDALKEL